MSVVCRSDRVWVGEFLRLFGDREKGLPRKDYGDTSFAVLDGLDVSKCSVKFICSAFGGIPCIEQLEYESFIVNWLLPSNSGDLELGLGGSYEPLDGEVDRPRFKRLNL